MANDDRNPRDSPATTSSDARPRHDVGRSSRDCVAELLLFAKEYEVGQTIGKGGFGEVRRVVCRATGQPRAAKIITLSSASNPDERKKLASLVKKEVKSLSRVVDLEACVSLQDACCTGSTYYLVTDLCEGGELLDEVLHRRFSEGEAAAVMRELVAGVASLHARGIIHGDLKLENVLLTRPGARTGVKICDFGMARELPAGGSLPVDGCFGSIHYVSPEVVKGSEPGRLGGPGTYDAKIDVWSLGVGLYIMLSGVSPFYTQKGESVDDVFAKIHKGKFSMAVPEIKALSPAGKDMLRSLLSVDPAQRPSAEEALRHPWLADAGLGRNERSGKHSACTPSCTRSGDCKLAGTAGVVQETA